MFLENLTLVYIQEINQITSDSEMISHSTMPFFHRSDDKRKHCKIEACACNDLQFTAHFHTKILILFKISISFHFDFTLGTCDSLMH